MSKRAKHIIVRVPDRGRVSRVPSPASGWACLCGHEALSLLDMWPSGVGDGDSLNDYCPTCALLHAWLLANSPKLYAFVAAEHSNRFEVVPRALLKMARRAVLYPEAKQRVQNHAREGAL